MDLDLRVSSVFNEGEFIPSKFSCKGKDVSPKLKIDGISAQTVSLAIIVDDPDAPMGTFVHWVAWNIIPQNEIPEGIQKEKELKRPIEMVQGVNGAGSIGYIGPCPPLGHGIHHYHFKIYALDSKLALKSGSNKESLESSMKGHIIQQGELVGLFKRD